MVRAIAGVPQVGSPVRLNGERADADLPPPRLGQHTAEVLVDFGMDAADAERLRAARIVG
jgi:formyl-CoA transferase